MEVETVQISCNACSVTFWVTKKHQEKLKRCHNTFYCPNGHSMYYPGKTDEEKLKEANSRLRSASSRLDAANRSKSALKGVITKMRNKS